MAETGLPRHRHPGELPRFVAAGCASHRVDAASRRKGRQEPVHKDLRDDTIGRSICSNSARVTAKSSCRQRWCIVPIAMIATALYVGASVAPHARADPTSNLKDAVTQLRNGTSCGSIRYDAIAEQVAQVITRTNDEYISHVAKDIPPQDPLPGLKDLGYKGKTAKLLLGAAKNEADAIKGALIEGYASLPDCSYTDYGADVRTNASTGLILTAIVLAGP
jgi:hypothetical protein